jgi:glycosyltransferase involved in cell wall biosynthesis
MISLSIIIPTYRRKKLLQSNLQSLKAGIQQYYSHYDSHVSKLNIIIVNDDPSCKIKDDKEVLSLKKDFLSSVSKSYITLMDNKSNLGLSGSRNVALSKVNTTHVVLLDDDDLLLPDYWRYVVPAIDNNDKYNIFYTGKYVEYEDYCSHRLRIPHILGDYNDRMMSVSPNPISVTQVTFSSKMIGNRQFDTSLRYNEDWDWWGQLFYDEGEVCIPKIMHIPVISFVYKFRCNSNSNMALDRNEALLCTCMEVLNRNVKRYNDYKDRRKDSSKQDRCI